MSILFALGACIGFALTDFTSGIATRRGGTARVVIAQQLTGFIVTAVAFFVFGGESNESDLLFGALTGLTITMALGFQFKAMRLGDLSLAIPLAGVVAGTIPIVYGIVSGSQPKPIGLVGMGFVVASMIALSAPTNRNQLNLRDFLTRQTALSLIAGTFFGTSLIFLGQIGSAAGPLPLVVNRAVAVFFALLLFRVLDHDVTITPGWKWPAIASGLIVTAALGLFISAVSEGEIENVGAIVALSPAISSGLAIGVLKERPGRTRLIGIALAVPALAFISLGQQ